MIESDGADEYEDFPIGALKEQKSNARNQAVSIAVLIPQIRHVFDVYWMDITPRQRNDLLRSVVSRVDYSKSIRGKKGVDPNQFTLTIYLRIIK